MHKGSKRPDIPRVVQTSILTKSRRRCALCFFLESGAAVVRGQIAHIDRNRENNGEGNLAYLCLRHDDEYDSTTTQSKRLLPEELIEAKVALEAWAKEKIAEDLEPVPLGQDEIPKVRSRVRPELFDRRIPIYRAFHRFIVSVSSEPNVSNADLAAFVNDTHDALFLFGEKIEEYLHQVYIKAIELRSLQRRMAHPSAQTAHNWEAIVNEETDCLLWFSQQLRNGNLVFYPYHESPGHRYGNAVAYGNVRIHRGSFLHQGA